MGDYNRTPPTDTTDSNSTIRAQIILADYIKPGTWNATKGLISMKMWFCPSDNLETPQDKEYNKPYYLYGGYAVNLSWRNQKIQNLKNPAQIMWIDAHYPWIEPYEGVQEENKKRIRYRHGKDRGKYSRRCFPGSSANFVCMDGAVKNTRKEIAITNWNAYDLKWSFKIHPNLEYWVAYRY